MFQKIPKKYGNKIYFDLKNVDYNVYSVNSNNNKSLDDKCYPYLRNLPKFPDLVNIVVSQKITKENVKECKNLEINKLWMQPGSDSNRALSGFAWRIT